MSQTKSKVLAAYIYIPLLLLIFIRPFFSGLTYPVLQTYYQSSLIFLAIISLCINKNLSLKKPFSIPIIVILSGYIISAIYSSDVRNSIKETILFLSYISIFLISIEADERQKNRLIKITVIVASLISIYSIYQYFWGYQHTLDYLKNTNSDFLLNSSYARDILISKRAIGTFPSPNILGGYLALVFFLTLNSTFYHSRERGTPENLLFGYTHQLLFLIPISFALILTKSLGVWLTILVTLIILFSISYKSYKKHRVIAILSFILIGFVLAFIVLKRWDRFLNLESPQNSITQRLNYWRTAIAVIKSHPIVGVGPGNFKEVFLKYRIGSGTETGYAHNIFLQTWAETGILGLIGIFYLIIGFLKKYRVDKFIFAGGVAFLLHNLIDNSYFIPQSGIFFWILLGIIGSSSKY